MANIGRLLLFGDKLYMGANGGIVGQTTPETPLPTIAVNMAGSSTVVEGDGASFTFTIELSATASEDTTFTYQTANGTALAGTDYTAAGGTGTIPAGQLSTTVVVLITNDLTYRGTRTFSLTISNAFTGPEPIVITNSTRTITIDDDDEAPVDPPPPAGEGSPLLALQHPRLVFVPEDSNYVFGRKLSDFRTRMNTATYSGNFQNYIGWHVARFNDLVSGKTNARLSHDGMAYAFFAMLDPATMPSFNFTYTKAQFLDKAKEHMMELCVDVRAWSSESGQDSSSEDGGPKSMGVAMMYDWIMAADPDYLTIADRQYVAETAVDGWKSAGSPSNRWWLSENSHYDAWSGVAIGLALYGDPISGNSVRTGLPFSQDIETMKDLFITRAQFMHDSAEFFRDGQGMHQESDAYYGGQWTKTASWAALIYGTALNTNVFYEYGFWRNRTKYLYMMAEPHTYSTTFDGVDGIPSNRLIKFDTTAGEDTARQSTMATRSCIFLEGFDDRGLAIGRWIVWDYWGSNPYGGTRVTERGDQLIYRFAYGWDHVSPIEPVAEVDIPLRYDGGMGRIILRDSIYPFEEGSTAIVYNNIKHRIGGHQHLNYNDSFSLYKWGTLTGEGGTGKSASNDTGSGGTNPFIQGNDGRLWGGDNLCIIFNATTTRNTGGGTYTGNNLSMNPSVCTGANCGIGTWMVYYKGTTGAASFMVNTTTKHSNTRQSYAARHFVWFPDEGGAHDYLVVWDRVTKHSTSDIGTFINFPTAKQPELLDGTWNLTLGPGTAGSVRVIPTGEWTGSGSVNRIKIVNDIDTADAVLYMNVLRPTSPNVYAVGGNEGWWGADCTRGIRNKESSATYAARNCGDVWATWFMRYRLEIWADSPIGSSDEYLRTLQLSRNSTTPTPTETEYIASTNGSMAGAVIKDANLTRVALAPTAFQFTLVNTAFTINLPSGSTAPARIVCSRISPLTQYTVSRLGNQVTFTPGSGSNLSTADGVLEVLV